MAAYGLYTHIRSNRIRSVLLLAGLFLLIYVIVFALALGFRAFTSRGDLSWYLYRAWLDLKRLAVGDRRRAGLDRHRLQVQRDRSSMR